MAYEKQKFISYSSRGGKSKIRVPAWSRSGEDPLPGCRLLIVSLQGRKWTRELSGVPLIKGTDPIHEDPTLKI